MFVKTIMNIRQGTSVEVFGSLRQHELEIASFVVDFDAGCIDHIECCVDVSINNHMVGANITLVIIGALPDVLLSGDFALHQTAGQFFVFVAHTERIK